MSSVSIVRSPEDGDFQLSRGRNQPRIVPAPFMTCCCSTRSATNTSGVNSSKHDQYYLDQFYTHVDADGRRWRRSDLTGSGVRHCETRETWRGIDVTAKGRHWMFPPTELERLDAFAYIIDTEA
jgi:hypothetical protein